eukprot:Skav208252  [mRNA]  locus=scaffold562:73436:73789:- [translate_table: standard]
MNGWTSFQDRVANKLAFRKLVLDRIGVPGALSFCADHSPALKGPSFNLEIDRSAEDQLPNTRDTQLPRSIRSYDAMRNFQWPQLRIQRDTPQLHANFAVSPCFHPHSTCLASLGLTF